MVGVLGVPGNVTVAVPLVGTVARVQLLQFFQVPVVPQVAAQVPGSNSVALYNVPVEESVGHLEHFVVCRVVAQSSIITIRRTAGWL